MHAFGNIWPQLQPILKEDVDAPEVSEDVARYGFQTSDSYATFLNALTAEIMLLDLIYQQHEGQFAGEELSQKYTYNLNLISQNYPQGLQQLLTTLGAEDPIEPEQFLVEKTAFMGWLKGRVEDLPEVVKQENKQALDQMLYKIERNLEQGRKAGRY